MTPVPQCDLTRVTKLVAQHHDAGQLIFDPAVMVAEAEAYRAFHAAARQPVVESDFDWDWLLSEGFGEGRLAGLLPDLEHFPDWAEEYVWEYFVDLATQQSSQSFEIVSDDEWEQLSAFMREPSQAIADTHPVLRHVPNAVSSMHAIEASRRYLLAKSVCERRGEPVVLRAQVANEAVASSDALELWIWLAPDDNNMEHDAPDVFILSASLIQRTNEGTGEIIAILHGQYIPLLMRGGFVHPDTLFEIMDAHSQKLNDVWKDVHGVFLRRLKLKKLRQLAVDYRGVAFCCPWIEVEESHRGQGLSAKLLRAVAETCQAAPDFSYLPPLDETEDPFEFSEEDDEEDAPAHPGSHIDMLEANPIRLFVIQVEGSRPEAPSRNLLARSDVRKVSERKDYNSSVERRRIALERYFQRINDPSTGFHIHTYNPWDYPFT